MLYLTSTMLTICLIIRERLGLPERHLCNIMQEWEHVFGAGAEVLLGKKKIHTQCTHEKYDVQ